MFHNNCTHNYIIWTIFCLLILLIDQTNFKYPLVEKQDAELRWCNIVRDKLNTRCRTCRRKLAAQVQVDKENTTAT